MLVHNLQKKIAVDRSHFEEFADRIKQHVLGDNPADFSIAFISDRRMKQLNEMFRGKSSTTDVLSFPHEPDEFETIASASLSTDHYPLSTAFLGDIVISAEQAQRQAADNGLDLETEIKQLILHGLLHLCGYDHETDKGEMDARELELRKQLGI